MDKVIKKFSLPPPPYSLRVLVDVMDYYRIQVKLISHRLKRVVGQYPSTYTDTRMCVFGFETCTNGTNHVDLLLRSLLHRYLASFFTARSLFLSDQTSFIDGQCTSAFFVRVSCKGVTQTKSTSVKCQLVLGVSERYCNRT